MSNDELNEIIDWCRKKIQQEKSLRRILKELKGKRHE